MKKFTFLASLLLAAVTLNSCSQESDLAADEAATQTAGAFTPAQKAQIMELAAYYDLDVTIDDRPLTRGTEQAFNIDSIDAEFRRVAALKGEYKCVQTDGNSAIFEKEKDNSTRPLRISRTLGETYSGEFSDVKNARGYWFRIHVSWKWSITEPGSVTLGLETDSFPYDLTREDFSYRFYGMQPSFSFEAGYKMWNMHSNKIYARLTVSGHYSNGYCSVSIS